MLVVDISFFTKQTQINLVSQLRKIVEALIHQHDKTRTEALLKIILKHYILLDLFRDIFGILK